MEMKEAWDRVAVAGREMGGGPAVVLDRFPEVGHWAERTFDSLDRTSQRRIALGVIVGRVAAEDPEALEVLNGI